jgi:hypothetical protein
MNLLRIRSHILRDSRNFFLTSCSDTFEAMGAVYELQFFFLKYLINSLEFRCRPTFKFLTDFSLDVTGKPSVLPMSVQQGPDTGKVQ